MTLFFITGNKGKFSEVKEILPDVEQLKIDLPEIQDIDPHKIIEAKLSEARKHQEGEFIVEDTSLYLKCLNSSLPGPLIKWFEKAIDQKGIAELAEKYGDTSAEARTIFGYINTKGEIQFFEGAVQGDVVSPRGQDGFGWDVIFKPKGFDKTFAEMGTEEKNKISMRKIAVEKLKEYLKTF